MAWTCGPLCLFFLQWDWAVPRTPPPASSSTPFHPAPHRQPATPTLHNLPWLPFAWVALGLGLVGAGCRCQILAQCISLLALDKFLSLFVPQFPHLCRWIRVLTSQGCWKVWCPCMKLQGPAGPHLGSVHLPSVRPWPASSHSAQCRGLLGPLFPVLSSAQPSHCCSLRLPSPACLRLMHPYRLSQEASRPCLSD